MNSFTTIFLACLQVSKFEILDYLFIENLKSDIAQASTKLADGAFNAATVNNV
ncbi:hypothetical protein NIES25_45290 [Nostoc linckia NIES-25]|nr:hypothetical protein NIES25_45290 [Nostoc linckia NIES-25]